MAAATLSACSVGGADEPSLTSLEIQALQKRDYDVESQIAFSSVLSVFQDLGYIIEDADKETGFITARSPAEDNTGFLDLIFEDEDFSVTKQTRATAVIESLTADRTAVRLNFVVGRTENSDYGVSNRDKVILDAETYQTAFDKIDDAIFIRQGNKS
jgi:hypothetical protein